MKLIKHHKKAIFSVIFLIFCITVFSQTLTRGKTSDTGLQQVKTNNYPSVIEEYSEKDTARMFLYLNRYLSLSDSVVPVSEKTQLLRKLSGYFAANNDYKTSYNLLKKADELEKELQQKELKQPETKKETGNSIRFSFYFFITSLIILFLVTAYFFWHRKNEKKQLNYLKNEYENGKIKLEEQRRKLDEKINLKTADLQQKIDELNKKEAVLKAELKKAEEANYFKNAFLANMGFDIRTPLNSIIGFANILETELAVRKNKELYNYAAGIEQSGYYLLRMLDNIIDLSGLEANTLQLEIKPAPLENIIEEITAKYEVLAREKGLIFKTKVEEDLPPVLADEKGLKKALNQIVENSIQYTDEGFVTVNSVYDEDHDLAVIEVIDTGVGMDKKILENIFRPVSPDKDEKSTTLNVGLGLKLAKKYVEMMSGQMLIKSIPEEGTTTTIQIPCSEKSELIIERETPKPEEQGRQVTARLHEMGKLDFFVVEDDRMNRMIIEKILSMEGDVTMAEDGDRCMEIIDKEAEKGHFFQVMLFDINLPEPWDGVKLMKETRKKYPEYRKIPFIAQTAYAMAGDKERFLQEGFDSYIAKPIDKNELINLVYSQLEVFKNR